MQNIVHNRLPKSRKEASLPSIRMSALTNDLVVVGYWGIRGLAAPLRMMVLFHGGYKLQCENYDLLDKPEGGFDASAWFSKKPELKEKHPLINLPYIIGTYFFFFTLISRVKYIF